MRSEKVLQFLIGYKRRNTRGIQTDPEHAVSCRDIAFLPAVFAERSHIRRKPGGDAAVHDERLFDRTAAAIDRDYHHFIIAFVCRGFNPALRTGRCIHTVISGTDKSGKLRHDVTAFADGSVFINGTVKAYNVPPHISAHTGVHTVIDFRAGGQDM